MATVKKIRERLNPLLSEAELYKIVFEVVKRFEAYLVDFQLLQLEKGEDIRKNIIGRYSRSTELEALFGKGPRPIKEKIAGQPYNFQWTGGFFDGMILEIKGDYATFTSRDSKTPLLKQKYRDIFGLQDDNLAEAIREKIGPAFAREIRKQILT